MNTLASFMALLLVWWAAFDLFDRSLPYAGWAFVVLGLFCIAVTVWAIVEDTDTIWEQLVRRRRR